MPPTLDRIDHIHIYVSDRAAAERWYKEVLGFQRIKELEFWMVDGGPLTLSNTSDTIHLALFERPVQARHSTIALAVSAQAFFEWRRHLSSLLGQSIETVDHEVSWSLYFNDPDGNPYEITCYDYRTIEAALQV